MPWPERGLLVARIALAAVAVLPCSLEAGAPARPQLLFERHLDPALNGAFVVADPVTGRAFASDRGGTLACIDVAAGRPCPRHPNATIGPDGGDWKLLGCMGRSEENNGIVLLMGMGKQAYLVVWPDANSEEPSASLFSAFAPSRGWQSLNCTGTSGAAADSETTLACAASTYNDGFLWALSRSGSEFYSGWNMQVLPSTGLRIVLAGRSASPILRQGGVWSPPMLFGPSLGIPSTPFGSDAAHAAVLDAPGSLDVIAGVAVSNGQRLQNAFAFAAKAKDLPVLPSTVLPWTRPLWAPCNLSLQVSTDSGRGVSACAMSAMGCLWGRKEACLSLLRTDDGTLLWEACGAALSAAAGQSAPANASALQAVFLPGPVASLTTVAALITWQAAPQGPPPQGLLWQYAVLAVTLDPTLPGGGPALATTSLSLGGVPCSQGDVQVAAGGVVAAVLSGCMGGAGSRLLGVRVAPAVASSASPEPPLPTPSMSPSPPQTSPAATATAAAPIGPGPVDGSAVGGAAAAATLVGAGITAAGLWWWAYQRAVPRAGASLLSHDAMVSIVQAPQAADPADEW